MTCIAICKDYDTVLLLNNLQFTQAIQILKEAGDPWADDRKSSAGPVSRKQERWKDEKAEGSPGCSDLDIVLF